jgi:uncharacterized RDD family membrane protein YckC
MEAHSFTRIVAYIVDLLIVSIFLTLITYWIPVSKTYEESVKAQNELIDKYDVKDADMSAFGREYYEYEYSINKETVVFSLISIVVSLGYYGTFAFYYNGQTLGKKLCKIKIVDNDGKEASHLTMILRASLVTGSLFSIFNIIFIFLSTKSNYMYYYLPVQIISSLFLIVSALMIIISKKRKGIHDYLLKTKVIETK